MFLAYFSQLSDNIVGFQVESWRFKGSCSVDHGLLQVRPFQSTTVSLLMCPNNRCLHHMYKQNASLRSL